MRIYEKAAHGFINPCAAFLIFQTQKIICGNFKNFAEFFIIFYIRLRAPLFPGSIAVRRNAQKRINVFLNVSAFVTYFF